nr:hypothetical protein [Tanacetum cinerariifolium]
MEDYDMTMEEHVQYETKKALRNGKVYTWELLRMVRSGFSSKDTVSSQHVNEINLKNETSLSKNNDEEYNVISYNNLFPFNIISVNDSKLDTNNDDDKIEKYLSMVESEKKVESSYAIEKIYRKLMVTDDMVRDDVGLVDASDVDLVYALNHKNKVEKLEEDFSSDEGFSGDEDVVCFNDVKYHLTDAEIRMFKETPTTSKGPRRQLASTATISKALIASTTSKAPRCILSLFAPNALPPFPHKMEVQALAIQYPLFYLESLLTISPSIYALPLDRFDNNVFFEEELVYQRLRKTLTHVLELSSCIYLDDRAWEVLNFDSARMRL